MNKTILFIFISSFFTFYSQSKSQNIRNQPTKEVFSQSPDNFIGITMDMNSNVISNVANKKHKNIINLRRTSLELQDTINSSITEKIIIPTSINTTLKQGLFKSDGTLIPSEDFWTVVYNLNISEYEKIDLSDYNIGVYGGAFLNKDDICIKAFSTDGGGSTDEAVPAGAKKIAVTVPRYKLYNNYIKCKYKDNHFKHLQKEISGNNHWYGKKIAIVGTSVAYGQNALTAYAKIASERLNFEIVPASLPGEAIHAKIDSAHGDVLAPLTYGSACLSKAEYQVAKVAGATNIIIPDYPIPADGENWIPGDNNYNHFYRTYENIFSSENKDVDLWIFAVVPNNTNFTLSDWDTFDKQNWVYNDGSSFANHRTTFLGALLFLMDKMYELNPKARMVFVIDSVFKYWEGKHNLKLLSETWNIPIIDLWGKINTSPLSLKVILSRNGTDNHPSTYGHELLGDMLINELLLIR